MPQTAESYEDQIRECYRTIGSFEYFLDQYVWIEDKATNQPIKLELWPDQRKVIPDFLTSRLLAILKAHQLGYTWIFVAARVLWKCITRMMYQVVVNSFNEDVGREIITRVNFIRNRLPEWMVPPITRDTGLFLEFMHKDKEGKQAPSTIQVIPATEKGGQSKTPNEMIFDESCFNRYVAQAFNGSLPGITQANGKITIISNAIKTAPGWSFTRSIYVGSMRGENDFKRIFLPWWANPNRSREIVRKKDGSVMMDEKGQPMTEFKLQMIRSGGKSGGMMDEEDFSQRYPETEDEAISILGGSYFGKTLARHTNAMDGVRGWFQRDEKTGDVEFVEDKRGIVEIWRHPYHLVDGWDGQWWTKRYCLGSDVSEGLGLSYSVGHVLDRHLDELVCRIRTNRMDAYRWADQLFMASEYYQNALDWPESGPTHERALVCPERTGAGQTTVHRLSELGANVYLEEIPATTGNPVGKRLGWTETNQSKHDLCEDLRHWFRTCQGTVYDAILLDEASTWIQAEGTNRLGPEEGHFGDCVISAGCTIQASLSMAGSPKKLDPPLTGWRKELFGEHPREERSPWAL